MLFSSFWGLKSETCYFLSKRKVSSDEHPCPKFCGVPPPPSPSGSRQVFKASRKNKLIRCRLFRCYDLHPGLRLLIMIKDLQFSERFISNAGQLPRTVKVLLPYAYTSMFIVSFPAPGLTSRSLGCPTLTSF